MYSFFKYFYCILLCVVLIGTDLYAQVQINEIMASNNDYTYDPDYNDDGDWIELYNTSDASFVLSGCFITDNKDNPEKWMISHALSIAPKSYLIIWADGRDNDVHTSFKLDAEGEFVGLFNPLGDLIDSVSFAKQRTNVSYGRKNDTINEWYYFKDPTPNNTNNSTTYAGIAQPPDISPESGFYSGAQSVTMTMPGGGEVARYTLDGSEPSNSSQGFLSAFDILQTTVIRARTYKTGYLPSEVINKTIFIDEPERTLPVFSISAKPDDLWDNDSGMYVNYEEDIEIPIGIEFFDNDQQEFQLNAGAEIYGGATRSFAQKSLDIKIRSRYGQNELKYRFFESNNRDVFKSFILRNSGNDWTDGSNGLGTMFCDGMQQAIIENRMDIDMQSYRPSVVYINGDYWGILNIREKQDDDYIAYYHGHNPDSLDMIKLGAQDAIEVVDGDTIHFANMISFIESHDMSIDGNYDYIKTQMDVSEFINYQIVGNFITNIDWPHNNNKFYRPKTPNGMWRWMLYDLDFGFNGFKYTSWPIWTGYTRNMYGKMLDATADKWANEIFINLIDNQNFVNEFVQRYAHLLNTTFTTDRMLGFIYDIRSTIDDEMPRHIVRWSGDGGTSSYSAWSNNIYKYEKFAKLRPGYAWQHTMDTFGLIDTTTLVITIVNPQGGEVYVNDLPLKQDSLCGNYFENIPLRLTAKALPGYTFGGWEEDTTSVNDSLTLKLKKRKKIKAVFEKNNYPVIINEVCASNNNTYADEFDEFDDWIELINISDSAVDLGGLYLTDDFSTPFKWQIPTNEPGKTTIEKNGYLLLWLDSEPYEGANHIGFNLSKSGEQIGLVMKDGTLPVFIDSFTFSSQINDVTYGRFPDGQNSFYYFEQATPLAQNDTTSIDIYEHQVIPLAIDLYPNPANNYFILRADMGNADHLKHVRIDILDINGSVMRSEEWMLSEPKSFDITNLNSGFYFVKIFLENNIIVKKLIKY